MNVNWAERKVVVIESDDWGICSWAPDRQTHEEISSIPEVQEYWENHPEWIDGTLESPDDLERLFCFLEGFTGRDGRPVVFTACYGVANPDYAAIRADDLDQYHDIFLDEGLPEGWERGDIVGRAREGMDRGVWCPGFHTRLHHAQPNRWLEAVREGSPGAAAIFEHNMFQCAERVGEYADMSPADQEAWIAPAIRKMETIFGRPARCAINSDATQETERIWAAEGIRCRMGRARDSWTDEEPSFGSEMGEYRESIDMTYLNRNTWLEPLGSADLDGPRHAREAFDEVLAAWDNNEPAICSSHRKNYVSLVDEQVENGYEQAAWWLETLTTQHPEVYFLTSWEVAQMYRQGASVQLLGDHAVCRNWTEEEAAVTVPLPDNRRPGEPHVLIGYHLPAIEMDGSRMRVIMPPGDYVIGLPQRNVE